MVECVWMMNWKRGGRKRPWAVEDTVTCLSFAVDGVWIGDSIYWTLTQLTITASLAYTLISVLSLLQSPLVLDW
jgi:hypothetical protein